MSRAAATSSIFSLVCANGLGHYRRTIGVLSRVKRLIPGVRISVWCAEWQVARSRDWDVSERFWADGTVRVGPAAGPEVLWQVEPGAYVDGSLSRWMDQLGGIPQLEDADLVVSDNLAGILDLRSDAILLGSFLWSDVLSSAHPDSPEVTGFAAHEQRLLDRFRPTMICVSDAVMPAVMKQTTARPVGWMTEETTGDESAPGDSVAVLGGATGQAAELLLGVTTRLLELEVPNVRVDPSIRDLLPEEARSRTGPFRHRREDFSSARVVICRPGMGTVTQCVSRRIPMLASYERNSPEMAFLGRRIDQLGIGVDLGSVVPEAATLREGLMRAESLTGPDGPSPFSILRTGGLDEAASVLLGQQEIR